MKSVNFIGNHPATIASLVLAMGMSLPLPRHTDVMAYTREALVRSAEEKLERILDHAISYNDGDFELGEYFTINAGSKALLERYGVKFSKWGLRDHIDVPDTGTTRIAVIQALNSLMKAKLCEMQADVKRRILKGLLTLREDTHFILPGKIIGLIDQNMRKELDDAGISIRHGVSPSGCSLITKFSL